MVADSMNGNHGHTFFFTWHRPLRGLEFGLGHCVGENYVAGTLPKCTGNGNEDFSAARRLCCTVSSGWRGDLASAKHWYSGRIDPPKFRWVLSRIGLLVSSGASGPGG